MTNFDFLKNEKGFAAFADVAINAEKIFHIDAEACAINCRRAAEFAVYGIIGVVGLLLNNLLLYIFTDHLHLHYMLSKLIAAATVLAWNFLGRKIILFKH